jgi:hypothetical protein
MSMHAFPWIVHASPAELFLPSVWAQRLLPERGLDEVLSWLVPYAEARWGRRKRQTRRVDHKPGRNEPCSCGSGKKYKRCCGAG